MSGNGGSEAIATFDPAGETSAWKHALVSFRLAVEYLRSLLHRRPRGVRCVCVRSRRDPRKGIAAIAVVATRAAGTGETVIGRVAVSTISTAATGVTGDRRVTVSPVTAAAAGVTVSRCVTVSAVTAATTGGSVSAVANVTDNAIGPAVAVNPGVSRCCTISGAVSTVTTATAGGCSRKPRPIPTAEPRPE